MSANYQRWLVRLYYSDTDVTSTLYNTYGELLRTDLTTASIPSTTFYVSQLGHQYNATHESAFDISGRPYSRNRGFTDSWNLVTTPYYFDSTGSKYQTLALVDNVMFALKYRHLWLAFTGQNLNQLTTGVLNNDTSAVKVSFQEFSETINNASSSRTATMQFVRKFRFDT